MKRKRRKKSSRIIWARIIMAALFIALFAFGVVFAIYRYAPTNEHMPLSEYYKPATEDTVAVILDGKYFEDPESDKTRPFAIVSNDKVYLKLPFIKDQMDDGYVYDYSAGILRYATDSQVVSASLNSKDYSIGRETISFPEEIILSQHDDNIYINIDFIKLFTDFNYTAWNEPNRVIIEKAGFTKVTANLKKDTAIRRFGGPKSKILKDAQSGEKLQLLEDYGKWSEVISEDGVIGCVRNRHIGNSAEETTEKNLEERVYNHILLEDPIKLGWHQVMSEQGNASLSGVLSNASGMNVISPTWFRLADNEGNIINFSNSTYVTTCHAANIQVWGLVSNLDISSNIDVTSILNSASKRDQLVNNLIAAAIAVGIDGLNIDFESLSEEAKDGYIQFIKELSIKCESNDLILSVDNYKPESFNEFYNIPEQAKYVDYIVIMAYDEHYSTSEEAGSTASISFVKEAMEDTAKMVPAGQILMGVPFYSRVWESNNGVLTNKSIGMKDIPDYISRHGLEKEWLENAGQNYVQYTENDKVYQLWVEDEESIRGKLQVAKDGKFAGIACWKLGLEPSSVWEVISGFFY